MFEFPHMPVGNVPAYFHGWLTDSELSSPEEDSICAFFIIII